MSRHYSHRSFLPSQNHLSSNNSFRRSSQHDFTHFRYPTESTSRHRFENPSTTSFTRHSLWEDHHRTTSRYPKHHRLSNVNIQSNHHERRRSRQNDLRREQPYYSNHRPSTHHISRSFDNQSYNHPVQHRHPSFYRQSIPTSSSNTYHRNGTTFEPPLLHRTTMSTPIHQQPSSSFLLTDLLHRVIDAHAASYSNTYIHSYQPPPASMDLIAYTWMSPNQEIFSLPTVFSIQFTDIFDLIISDETPVVGLTESELERLPTIIYSETCTNMKNDDKCAVCLNEYINGEKLKSLRCKHYFHSECIDPWLKTSTRCPICRGEQTN